jgi:hypothetical protein
MVEIDELIALQKKVELFQQMAEDFIRTSPYTRRAKKPAAPLPKKEESTMAFDIDQITTENMRDPEKAAAAGAAIRAALDDEAKPVKRPKVTPYDIERITVEEMQDPNEVQHAVSAILQALHPDDYES